MDENSSRQPDDDSPQPRPPRPGPERAPGSKGGNLIWVLLVLGLGTLLLVSVFQEDTDVEIPIGKLYELIEQGAPEKNPQAAVEVSEGSPERRVTYRFSELGDLTIGPHEVTGTVTIQQISPTEKPPQRGVKFSSPRLGVEDDQNRLFELARAKGFVVRAQRAPAGWRYYMPMIVFTLLFAGLFFFMLRRLGGAGSAMAFGRSRGRLIAQEDVGITFEDVAGIDEAVEELREVVDFLKNPGKYQVLGGRIPKGVLLVGPPGTGKTLLAKAIAGEAGCPFFSLSGSDFVEMFVGVGAARVRDMFQQAQARAPCIVFIDELDALGKMRGTSIVGGHDEREQTLNALLVEMDGFSSNSGVIVMAATNRPETLDPALLRPGRFDRHVLVDRPDVRGREAILKVQPERVNPR